MRKLKKYYPFDYKIIIKLSLGILFAFVSQGVKGQKIIELVDGKTDYVLQGDLFEVLEDVERKYTISDIGFPQFDGFTKNKSDHTFNKNSKSAYWLKFNVKNSSTKSKRFLLETYSPHSNLIEVYCPSSNGTFLKQEGGENFKFGQRQYLTKNLIFNLPLGNETVTTFYIRIVSKNYSAFDFRIKTIDYFLFYMTHEYYFLGLYYGILLIMAIYNLMVYLTVKENVYLYYLFYVLCSAVVTMTDDGLGFQYLWPNFPSWSRPIGYTIAPILQMIIFILYSSSFLDLKNRFPILWKTIYLVTGFYLVYFVFSILLAGNALPILFTVPFLTVYLVACISYAKGYKASRYFIIGYTFILISIVIIQLRAEHIIQGNFFTVYSLNIGLLLEVVIFSFALSDRIKIIKRERELRRLAIIDMLRENKELQEKVNRELEEKVAERTQELLSKNQELEEVNKKLYELNELTNQINAKLDHDNWYLKKDRKEDLQARILEEEVSYEEFSKIFSDDLACQKYLTVQKWDERYRCRKCGKLKYTEYENKTKRKCTVCGFVESSTAFTIFHGVRFPLNKAFYLTYLFFRKTTGRNISELADFLEIRRNTCVKFKSKVLENKELYNLTYNRDPNSWEELIVVRKKEKVNRAVIKKVIE